MFFVYLDSAYASEAETKEEAKRRAARYFIRRLCLFITGDKDHDMEFLVEEEK